MLRKLLLFSFVVLWACGGKPKYPSCDGDKDCKPKERCVLKKCVQCGDNTHCPEGTECVNGGCKPSAGFCNGDSDCGLLEVCKNHKCTSCENDGECGPGGKCRSGKCIRPGNCETDQDCPEDQDCVNFRCVKPGSTSKKPSCALEPVFFGFDVYTLSDAAKTSLTKNFDCLKANPTSPVAVIGHTDARGTVEYNVTLSDDRAQAVITYLGRMGIDPARMHKVPKGAAEAKGVDEAGFANDRRVELVWE